MTSPEEQRLLADRALLIQTAREIAESLLRLATTLESDGSVFGPTHSNLPWPERTLRQSLIIRDILEEGGTSGVPKDRWYEIAAKYGYTGRGVAGFFREGSGGLLEMRKNGNVVVTKRGRERLSENRARIDQLDD